MCLRGHAEKKDREKQVHPDPPQLERPTVAVRCKEHSQESHEAQRKTREPNPVLTRGGVSQSGQSRISGPSLLVKKVKGVTMCFTAKKLYLESLKPRTRRQYAVYLKK